MESSEQVLWKAISRGDKKAYEELFRAYYSTLCRYAKSMIQDIDEAEEVVQNIFYIIWNKRETIEINGSLKSYLYRAAHNDCLNKLKHQKVRQIYAEDYKQSVSKSYEDSSKLLQAKELKAKIDTALSSLPEQCGKVFRLSRFEELKYQEIAEQLNISVKTVEIHMSKALKIMREQLKDYLPLLTGLFYYIYEALN